MKQGLAIFGVIGFVIIFGAVAAATSVAVPAPVQLDQTLSSPAEPAIIAPTAAATAAPTNTPVFVAQAANHALVNEPINSAALVQPTQTVSRAKSTVAAKPTTAPRATSTPRPAATSIPPVPVTPGVVNGISIDTFLVLPDEVRQNIRTIYARGQQLGNHARAFAMAGDSTIETPYFLAAFDGHKVNLGGYSYLQATVDYYAGSFARNSTAVRVGQHAWTVMNPVWADKKLCQAQETPLACEFRLMQPSVVIIRLGVNDAGVPKLFDTNLRKVVAYSIEQGVIPILSTKPDQRVGTEAVNGLVKAIAAEYKVPLWDYEAVAKTLPSCGLGADGAHMTSYPSADYRLEAAYSRGHAMQSLTALMVLDKVRQAVNP